METWLEYKKFRPKEILQSEDYFRPFSMKKLLYIHDSKVNLFMNGTP